MTAERTATSRWKALLPAWELDSRLARAKEEERAALEAIGRGVPGSLELADAAAAALLRVRALEDRSHWLSERLTASFEADRRDYRETSSEPGRWLVVGRGLLDRLVLRVEARSARSELPARYAELGAHIVDDPARGELVNAAERERVIASRTRQRELESERAVLLARFGGEALPRWLRAIVNELATFFDFVRVEVEKKLLLRLPALAAMAVAWWLARAYARSSLEASVDRVFGSGDGLSDDAVAWLVFWVPLLTAALVAYGLAKLTKRVRRRYLGEA